MLICHLLKVNDLFPGLGAFVPSCDEDGFFERQQCHGSTGQCWCVDRNGHEIRATRTQGPLDCGEYMLQTTSLPRQLLPHVSVIRHYGNKPNKNSILNPALKFVLRSSSYFPLTKLCCNYQKEI